MKGVVVDIIANGAKFLCIIDRAEADGADGLQMRGITVIIKLRSVEVECVGVQGGHQGERFVG